MNLNSDLIDKTLLENEIRNVKYKYSKRDTLYLNDDNEQIRIKREVSDITNAAANNTIFNINYTCHNLNTGEEFYNNNLSNETSEKEILKFSNKFFKNIIKTKRDSRGVYGSSYNKFFYYNCQLHEGDQKPEYINHVTHYPDIERRNVIRTPISDTSNKNFYKLLGIAASKARIYFNSRQALTNYHYVLSRKKRDFRDYFNDNNDIFTKIDATYPFKPISYGPTDPGLVGETIGLKGSYKDSFKFNYPSQGASVPDHVDKNLNGIYSYGAGYRYNKLLNIDKPTFTGWTHAHNDELITTHSGNINSHWIVGENQQFMFGSDFDINNDENIKAALLDIRKQDLRFIENWQTFNDKNNYFGIMTYKKLLNIHNPFIYVTRVQKILYNYSNIENKHYNCGRYAKSWGRNENVGSATQPNWVWKYYWDEIDYYSEDKYNYGMHCGYALDKTINESDNLGITILSKSKLPISIIKKNNNHAFLNTNYKLQKGYSPTDTSNLQNLVIPEDFSIKNSMIIQ